MYMHISNTSESLMDRWQQLKATEPRLRTKDIADRLDVSEAELVAASCDGREVVRLNTDWAGQFARLESLGRVMALTRNHAAVHEKHGLYQNVSFEGHAGLVLDENIDLRIFYKRWSAGFALPVAHPQGPLHSLQFFDKQGEAVHKIYLKKPDEVQLAAYYALVEDFRAEEQSSHFVPEKEVDKKPPLPLAEVDGKGFMQAWSQLKDTHDFHPMLRKFRVSRTDALRLARTEYAWQMPLTVVRYMLELAAKREVPIMVFVGNRGMIQIHSGPVRKIKMMNDWLNVLDPEFNLHLNQGRIAECWLVEKPTEDGPVHSLELYDAEGATIASFFGARKPGIPQRKDWEQIIHEIRPLEAV